ncbi:Uncharacterized protein TCM_023904 [Theobroma cacao]|uniref:Uncharacterized protein n=1 Tax=Theobroma cacao TaxID=3641 RepID=A0A061EUM9_THECC|nr:Uncharacterized protein TCM_023904 [Theobroma cacao]
MVLGDEHFGKSKEIVPENQESEYLEFDSRNREARKTDVKPCKVSIDIPDNECLSGRCGDCHGFDESSG